MFCIKCGRKLEDDWKICPNCGQKVNSEKYKEAAFSDSEQTTVKGPTTNNIKKMSKLNTILFWGLMICGLVIGVIMLALGSPITGILYIIAGILLCPLIMNKFTWKKRILVVAIVLVLCLVGVMAYGGDTKDGSEYAGVLNDSDTETDNVSVKFTTDWYKTYTYFKEENSGEILEMSFLDGGYIQAIVNDTVECVCMDNEYTQDSDGAYVYDALVGGGQIRYYPESGNYVEIFFGKETKRYNPVDASEIEDSVPGQDGYYLTDYVPGNNLNVHVRAVYFEVDMGYTWIRVPCEIRNISEDTLTLNTPEYFSLNNNGIIKYGYCDYDYSEIAVGASLNTTISFAYPENANVDFSQMVMTVDGIDVSLADKPQSQQEKDSFEGIYNRDGSLGKVIVEDLYNGSYNVIIVSYWAMGDGYAFNSINSYTVTLSADNTFDIGYSTYQWNPEEYSICSVGDYSTTYYK